MPMSSRRRSRCSSASAICRTGKLNIDKARIALGVLIFPDFRSDFSVADDAQAGRYPAAAAGGAGEGHGDEPGSAIREIRACSRPGTSTTSRVMVICRRSSLDFFYGIDANQFAARSALANESGRSTLPDYQVANRQNLGYSAQATLNIPVWNWGATRSKVKQAELKQQQAELDLTLAQRTLQGNLATAYREAQAALAQLDSLRSSSDLSAESLRLTLLRYQAGEANALEVVDAQTTLAQARNAYDDGLVRYRLALANLQTLTGTL